MTDVTNLTPANSSTDEDKVLGIFGNTVAPITLSKLKEHFQQNDDQILHETAFFIDINARADDGNSKHCNVGGNLHMLALWRNEWKGVIMDSVGNAALLSDTDHRYTADGLQIVDGSGALVSAFENVNYMGICPLTYGRLQTISVNGSTRNRLWLSLIPLPGGFVVRETPVGMFKMSVLNGKGRSIPNQVPANNVSICNYDGNHSNNFFDYAQAFGKDYGLAGVEFRNMLLWYMMAAYGQRDCQNATLSDGTLIWGVGLDGTENTTGSSDDGFTRQKNIKTGATLSLGKVDGKAAVEDSAGGTCHSVKVAGLFENPWGQYWEMDGHLCSIGTKVIHWKKNFMPLSATPSESTFGNVPYIELTRHTAEIAETAGNHRMNEVLTDGAQGMYMIPSGTISGVNYGDKFFYGANGQLWLWGGTSYDGASCGLASSASSYVWSNARAYISARLDFHGTVNMVSGQRLQEILAAS